MDPLITEIQIPTQLWKQMHDDVKSKAPEEACGLLAGNIMTGSYQAHYAVSISNILHSPVRYRMDPYEQLQAFNDFEAQDWELVGIYHSHPHGPSGPSPTDIAEAYYPDVVYLIWYVAHGEWRCKGYLIRDSRAQEIFVLQ